MKTGLTGGRWRRIVLGDVLAKHVIELRGRARRTSLAVRQVGSVARGSFGSRRRTARTVMTPARVQIGQNAEQFD